MGVHMTLRCIAGGEIYNQDNGLAGCDGNFLDIAAGGTRQSVLESAERLFSLARQAGWRRCQLGWICPDCARQGDDLRPVVQPSPRRRRTLMLNGVSRVHLRTPDAVHPGGRMTALAGPGAKPPGVK